MRRRVTKRAVVGAGLAAVLAVGGAVAVGVTTDGRARLRTATAGYHAVTETIEEVGTLAPVASAEVAFPAAGTVATVAVRPGDEVTVGQVLATLDPAPLEAAVREARAALDRAELALADAQAGGAQAGGDASGSVPSGPTAPAEGDDALRAARRAVLDAQARVDDALAAAGEALASAEQVCAAATAPSPPTTSATTSTTTSATTTTAATTTAPATTTTSIPDAGDGTDACAAALTAALDAQTGARDAQDALGEALAAYGEALAARAGVSDTASGTDASGGSDTPPAPAAGAASPERLAALQAAVDAAAADLFVAVAARAQTAIVSPIDGTVVTVGFAPGDEVTAGSTTATIVIDGDGGFEATALVGVDDLPDVEVGQSATVTPDGSGSAIAGEVVRVGLVPVDAGGGAAYPVTIALPGSADGLRHGSVASVSIVVGGAGRVLAVPTSAVLPADGGHRVRVLDGGEVEEVEVEVGAVGPDRTEIRAGLAAGDVVVLADLDEPLPGTATDGEAGRVGGPPGGWPPAGGPPGGVGGPPGR
ncbi:MAG: hypothetical protein KatS3mg009_0994 [Acidimicrobiia bacterium]|nr:MAG: hypothetical protein KatS3mg009_0994 [Acidimicrobiia bacterium]